MIASFRSTLISLALLAPLPALAESPRTILVLDGSGSMWGQIEGEAKISIARTVVGDLLGELPTDMELGLTVYGHRRKGDCGDIESVVPVGANTTEAIRSAVNNIKPKGKTPLSAAVLAAGEELKYTEEKATVILVSDGRETCDVDPCEIGKQLEETGVDFTAHVVGFDVSNPEDQAQLQCLAENTGGTFVSASNAVELKDALAKVAAPTEFDVTFVATDGEDGSEIATDLIWTVRSGETALLDHESDASPTLTLLEGEYTVEVLRPSDEASAEATFKVDTRPTEKVVLVLGAPLPKASITAPDTAELGSTIKVEWEGPDEANDYIAIFPAGDDDAKYTAFTYAREGSPLKLLMPSEPGDYEIRYIRYKGRTVLASSPISITEAEVTVTAPETATLGSTIQVEWKGPDASSDFIAIYPAGDDDAKYSSFTYTREGSPLKLLMPSEPGDYEIRYVLYQDRAVLASTPISITEGAISVTAPETATLGSTIKVEWEGPDASSDFIAIYPAGDDEAKYTSYTYTREGNPLKLLMPNEPGDYEIRYIFYKDRSTLATTPISITEAKVSLSAPETADLGSTISVAWEGPDAQNDFIGIYPAGDEEGWYTAFTRTRKGSPLKLLMPAEPGDYEIRYVLYQGGVTLASRPISIVEAEVNINAPETAIMGTTLSVEWQGPNSQNDFIAIYPAGDDDAGYSAFTRTRKGNPLKLQMPMEPGDYEIRYVLYQGKVPLTAHAISITEATASLEVPETAKSGSTLDVTWRGPDAKNDYIAIFPAGDDEAKYIARSRTRKGSPLKLRMPREGGEYEIRYVFDQNRSILAAEPITVEAE